MRESALSWKEKNTQTLVYYFRNANKYLTSFMTDQLNIVLMISVYDF